MTAVIPLSVIVPAHDEETVIARCLRALLDGAERGELELIVVCNGCRDDTAAIARSVAPEATVVELPLRSKTAALNTGDRLATRFPRFYVDADVTVDIEALRATAAVLRTDGVLCASPRVRYGLTGRPWLVRSYFQVWRQLPYLNQETVGCGVYGLSEVGRARFSDFPDIIADDQFVLQHFDVSERKCLRDVAFDAQAPYRVGDLLATRRRVYRGNRELDGVRTPSRAAGGVGRVWLRVVCRPSSTLPALAYAAVCVTAKMSASLPHAGWERDESSRRRSEATDSAPVPEQGATHGAPAPPLFGRGGEQTRPAVCYVVSRYPAPSHTFVLREVQALRGLGVEVTTFSVRRPDRAELLCDADRREAAQTTNLLPVSPGRLLRVHAGLWRRSPTGWLRALGEAVRSSPPGARALLWQLFYLAEAGLLFDACSQAGTRRLHAHLANVAADVAWLATRIGRHLEPGGGWSWSFTMHGPTEFSEVVRYNLARKVAAADDVVCISDYCRSQLMRLVPSEEWSKLQVLRCGVDTAEFGFTTRPGRDGGVLTVLTVGRLVPDKGHAVLLEAASRLLRAGRHDLRYLIAGAGPLRGDLEGEIKRLGLGSHVTLLGACGQDSLVGLFRQADLFCLPSFAEGLPIVLMEAMATGLPVVATSVAAVAEIVQDGVTGIVVPAGHPERLAEALALLADSPERREEMGRVARLRVEDDYDLHRNVGQLARWMFPARWSDETMATR